MPTTRYINRRFNQELADEEQRFETSSLVAASYIQGWLSHFAFTNRIPEATLTSRVSSILSNHEVRSSAPDSLRMGALYGRTANRTVRIQPLEMASDARAYGARKKGKVTAKRRKQTPSFRAKMKAYWTPKRRREQGKRMKRNMRKLMRARKEATSAPVAA